MEYAGILLMALVSSLPALLFWIVVLVLGIVILYRNSGGRAEKFLIAGIIIKFTGVFLSVPSVLLHFLVSIHYNTQGGGHWITDSYNVFLNTISMAGIICLIFGFWVKFKEHQIQTTSDTILERENHA